MADQTKKICCENKDSSTKTRELLTHLSSTVFACDISGDTRYIRCDFPQCREHAEALQGKPCWILNTLKNVRVLDNHVGREVNYYMKEIDSGMQDQLSNPHYAESQHWIEAQALPEGTRKVLAVFNLKDPQSQFGDWISLFLKAAFMAEGVQGHGCVVITQNFVSRYGLMECIAKLSFLSSHLPTVEVVAALSCHSSCQGQVFSCTPFAMGKQCGFEEFCSLHDFVMACHNVLNNVLVAVHISSCFTLKLDCSHVDWPVDADWLRNKLQCILSGSTREVYETGSQVADLHLMLSTMLPSSDAENCGTRLRSAVLRACLEGFPDLAREMGLEVLDPDSVRERLSREGREDEVTPPGLVMSSVRVVFLVQEEDPGSSSKAPYQAKHCGSYTALAEAITANLRIRKASDVRFEYTIVQVKHIETLLLKESLKKELSVLPIDNLKVLFIAMGPMFSRPSVELIDIIKDWSSQKAEGICYGVHFQHITAMQAYAIKNRLKQIQDRDSIAGSAEAAPSRKHLSVTGLVDNGDKNCSASFPVLLYMIHLAVGENGNRLAGKGIPSAVYSNKPVGHGVSSWTLEEVYMETCHVLSGLSRKCGLHLLSPASSPERPAVVQSSSLSSAYRTFSEKTAPVTQEQASPSSSDFKRGAFSGEMDSSVVNTPSPLNQDGTISENKPCCVGVLTEKSSQERDRHSGLSSCDGCPRASSTTTPVLDDSTEGENACRSEGNEGENIEKLAGFEGLEKDSINTGSFLEAGSSAEMKASTKSLDQNDLERDEKPVSGMCDTKPSSTIEEDVSEGIGSSCTVTDTEQKGWPTRECDTQNSNASQSCTGAKVSLQVWLQDFKGFCKGKESIRAKESSQGPPGKKRKKNPPKGSSKREFISGNLESKNKCLGVSKGSACLSEVSATTARSSALALNLQSESNEQIITSMVTSNNVEMRTESVSVSHTQGDLDKNTNYSNSADNASEKRALSFDYPNDVNERIPVKKPRYELECESKSDAIEESRCSTSSDWDKSEDLPLMANVDEVRVNHYILDLTVKFREQIMKGSIVLFIEPTTEEVTGRQFQMSLDSTLVNIESVSEVVLPDDFKLTFNRQEQSTAFADKTSRFLGDILGHNTQTPLPFKGLSYSVYGWCVQIWKPKATGKAWPRCIWINYHTSPEGKSLTWATDQDGKPCVYSPGAYINNRSLMPCQEPPLAMSTWQASIHVPEGCVVLMSGNELVGITAAKDGQVTYLYEMETPLPCSTLAVAAGWWECRPSRLAVTKNGDNPSLPVTCRMFAPPSVIERAADELLGYAPKFVEAACELLGPYPFRRLDMLILPKCFACMGLKSPNLAFLSQSLLSEDASMRVRLAHEISHAWFGLLVGAKDWSEEWLSEGFATFIEEKIQSRAERWSKDKDRFYREMRQTLRYRCLLFEIKECDDNLKFLRPKVVKPPTDEDILTTAEAIEKSAGQSDAVRPHTVVQFGQICSRKWTQVHYLKGYFLLHHLAMMVGRDEFDTFLFSYVQHYSGQLVSSEEFFEYFVQSFPDISSETKKKFITEWLESARLPKSFPKKFESPDNELLSQVELEFQTWKKQDTIIKRNKTLRVRKRKKPPTSTLELPEQVVLFLEKLLERDTISHTTLRQLDKCYNFSRGNAEIRHRWCELVVKHNYTPGLKEVKRFLVEDQGMGIYLFGELIISQQPKQRALVDEVLEEIGGEMDRCTYQTVKDMLEGND